MSFLLVMTTASLCFAQSWRTIRLDIVKDLTALRPKNKAQLIYRVRVPARPRTLPQNIRVDLVYKDGHYDFGYMAVRFERRAREPLVQVSYFSFESALPFWREYSKRKEDNYQAKSGTMSVAEFDALLTRALGYYDSDIEEIYVPSKPLKRNGKLYYHGMPSTSRTSTSGDGSIVIGVRSGNDSIIKRDGSLYGGNLKSRMDNGYDEMRPNLFWKVFHDRLESSDILHPIPTSEIESVAIARLNEPKLSDSYRDFYRQSLFIEILGEFGTANSLETLKRLSFDSGLEPTWHENIQGDVSHAIKKISSRP